MYTFQLSTSNRIKGNRYKRVCAIVLTGYCIPENFHPRAVEFWQKEQRSETAPQQAPPGDTPPRTCIFSSSS